MNKETVLVNRKDLEDLKKCFLQLTEENEELRASQEVEPEEIGIDLSGFNEMLNPTPTDDEILASVGEVDEVDPLDDENYENETDLSNIIVDRG